MAPPRFMKRTQPKSMKRRHNHHHFRRRNHIHHQPIPSTGPIEVASSLFKSLNQSIVMCHRRIVGLFSTLTGLGTATSTGNAFKIFNNKAIYPDLEPEPKPKPEPESKLLALTTPPLKQPTATNQRKTIFLDLDETLVHATMQMPKVRFDFIVRPEIDDKILNFFVVKRPGVDEFLEKIAEKYEVVVFTAGLREYASLVLDQLDKKQLISHRLYRESCKELNGKLVKDLARTGRDLSRAVIVDDNPGAYALQPENAVPIKAFVDDLNDNELGKLGEFFDRCVEVDDTRVALREFLRDQER